VVSYCLVIYYHNYVWYNSGMVTVLCNRIGDVGILMTIRILIIFGRWEIVIFEGRFGLILLLMLAAITKRAQIPFSVWLPLAMIAPIPVSTLVHSSTLVTAEVYLIIRFNKFLMETGVRIILSLLLVITIFISGLILKMILKIYCFINDPEKDLGFLYFSIRGFIKIILSNSSIVIILHDILKIRLLRFIFKILILNSLGIKIDFIPGHLNQILLLIRRPKIFLGQCLEICDIN
ncbi:NU5M oxidoreductase, partial [Pseudoatta argentina]